MATDAPDPSPVLDLLNGFRKSKVMFAGITLGVFDALAAGPKTAPTLATELAADADALERLLHAAVMVGLLEKAGDAFRNTPAAAAYLTKDSPRRMLGYAGYSDRVLWKMWDHLPDAVREGTNRWKQTFGGDAATLFGHFYSDDAAKREFLFGMHGFGIVSSPVVADAVDLGRYKTFADLGGATGHLTIAALRRWPNLRGVVFDLPQVLPLTKEVVGATEVADRVGYVGGDFFADPLPPADVYALGRIVHDWTEPKIVALLAKIFAALPAGGALLVCEKLLDDSKTGPEWAVLQSVNMLVCTEGKERTVAEYEALLTAAGFGTVTAVRTGSPLDAILAVKA